MAENSIAQRAAMFQRRKGRFAGRQIECLELAAAGYYQEARVRAKPHQRGAIRKINSRENRGRSGSVQHFNCLAAANRDALAIVTRHEWVEREIPKCGDAGGFFSSWQVPRFDHEIKSIAAARGTCQ